VRPASSRATRPSSSSLTPQAALSLLPANQAGIHSRRSSSPHMSVHQATLGEPADVSIPLRTSRCLHLEVSIL